MKALAGAILEAIVLEEGAGSVLVRLSDPIWFQALGCLLGFDWHSSGLTTTTTGALKEALRLKGRELGIFMAGGKGKVSRKTPEEVKRIADEISLEADPLIYASRMAAKVDTSGLQDGYQIYHHVLVFTRDGKWTVIQQGMNPKTHLARRYHWLSDALESFVVEPHKGILSPSRGKALNLVAKESIRAQDVITELSKEDPQKLSRELIKLKEMKLPQRHKLLIEDLNPNSIKKILLKTYSKPPRNFEDLLGMEGVGPKTIRALALLSDLIYGVKPSYEDPFVYSYAHGGKDGTPYPVDREVYNSTIEALERAISKAKLGDREKLNALRKLGKLFYQ